MPKVGAEPLRKAALIDATISAVGRAGTLDVTVAQIARQAGMSTALAHYYFGSKDQIFLAAMRHILGTYGRSVRSEMPPAPTPRQRLEAILRKMVERAASSSSGSTAAREVESSRRAAPSAPAPAEGRRRTAQRSEARETAPEAP